MSRTGVSLQGILKSGMSAPPGSSSHSRERSTSRLAYCVAAPSACRQPDCRESRSAAERPEINRPARYCDRQNRDRSSPNRVTVVGPSPNAAYVDEHLGGLVGVDDRFEPNLHRQRCQALILSRLSRPCDPAAMRWHNDHRQTGRDQRQEQAAQFLQTKPCAPSGPDRTDIAVMTGKLKGFGSRCRIFLLEQKRVLEFGDLGPGARPSGPA